MLERVGSHWIHPDRELHSSPSCSIELVYQNDPPAGFAIADARERVTMARAKGDIAVFLRVDYQQGQTLPPTNDEEALLRYIDFSKEIAADTILGQSAGIISGNETNLSNEWRVSGIPLTPRWVARVVFGSGTAKTRTDNVYSSVRDVNPNILVFSPAVGPFSPESTGELSYTPPDGRDQLTPWETYQYELAYRSYRNNGHTPTNDVFLAMHTYSRVGVDGTENGGAFEPQSDIRENTFGSHWGTQSLDDMLYAIKKANRNRNPAGIVISEWNSLTDAAPIQNYPKGLEQQTVSYINGLGVRVLGFACFVDQDYGGMWVETAMTGYLGTNAPRLFEWDQDHDFILRTGW